MEILSFSLGMFATNCYYIRNEEKNESIIIDPGTDAAEALAEWLQKDKVVAILLTHAHLDHIYGLESIREMTHAPIYIHKDEKEWLHNPEYNGSIRWPQLGIIALEKSADVLLNGGEELALIGQTFKVLYTPGHSPGSVSYIWNNHCFSGDALFEQSIGRTDLYGGNYDQLISSIKNELLVLPDDTFVHPGHGSSTTIGKEKRTNPFIRS